MTLTVRAVGAALDRIDGPDKVRGTATYAFEQLVDHPAYVYPVQATIAVGRITGVDTSAATAVPGVLDVLTYRNAPRLASTDDLEMAILQVDRIDFRGQFVGCVIAETPEIARQAAALVRLQYEQRPHDVELSAERDDLYAPLQLNAEYHIATNADVGSVQVHFLAEDDPYVNPMGSKGIGEVGIVGAAAAIVNAAYHATGIRVRDLPLTLDKLLLPSLRQPSATPVEYRIAVAVGQGRMPNSP
jgi:CO/xanthine dehydrogenase Mo-binding subunit